MLKIPLYFIQALHNTPMRKIWPLILGVIFSIAVLFLWYQLSLQEQQYIEKLALAEATKIEMNLSHELTNRIRALQRMAKRWEKDNGTTKVVWESDASAYLNDFYGYRAIEYVDTSYHVRWIVPLEGNEAAQNLDLSQEPRRQITLKIAQDLRQPILSGTISLAQGRKGFLVCVPLFVGERFDGFILGVLQIPEIFEGILPVSENYQIKISDRNQLIYSQGSSFESTIKKTVVVKAYSVNWEIDVFPNPKLLAKARSMLPQIVLTAGLILTWLFVIVLYLVQLSYRRICQFQQINRQLQQEIAQRKQIETELKISQSRFAGILDIARDAIISVDQNQRITLFNQGAEQIFGYSSQEILGQPLNILLPERFAKTHDNQIQNYSHELGKARQMAERGRIFGRRKDGTEFPAEASVSQMNFNGEVIFTTFLRDITAKQQAEKALQESEATKQAIIEAIPDLLIRMRSDGTYLDAIASNEFSIFQSDRHCQAVHLSEILPRDLAEKQMHYTQKALQLGTMQIYEQEILIKEQLHYEEIRIVPLLPNEVLIMVRDITEQQAALRERQRIEIELRNAMEAAEAANLAKSIFLANMSHELRTPLNVILGFTQVMARDVSLTSSQIEDLEAIRRSGDHLLSLINDILDISKIESGHYTLEETAFDLIALLHSLRSMLSERAIAQHLKLIFDISSEVPQFIISDAQKLRQILLNLLSNAIKFTNKGTVTLQVTVEQGISKTERQSDNSKITLQFQVIDTGVGIAAEELATIFDAFVQAQAGKKSANGTGLGLTISRKLVELMGGEISVQSTEGKGSKFLFSIAVRLTSGVNVQPQQSDRIIIGLAPHQSHHRILVVDDQKENRLLLVKLLTKLGFQVREASNGKEAVQHWQEWQPDLTWMDIRMPILDGYEATKQIRSLETEPASIIIALTAQASQSDRTLALAAGCNDYISKPFREETLFLKMQEYLGLNYIYAETKATADQESNLVNSLENQDLLEGCDRKILNSLPKKWFTQMENAAVCGDDVTVTELISQLPSTLSQLSIYLTKLANDYQFEEIIRLLSTLSSSQ
jgi:PAS domain S-box-containing protein